MPYPGGFNLINEGETRRIHNVEKAAKRYAA